MSNFYELSENYELKSNLFSILSKLDEIILYKSSIKKLSEHPINDWHEYFSNEIYSDMVTPAHLLINEKESFELLNDFTHAKTTKLLELIIQYRNLSVKVSENFVEKSLRDKYLESIKSTFGHLHKDEVELIKIMRSIGH